MTDAMLRRIIFAILFACIVSPAAVAYSSGEGLWLDHGGEGVVEVKFDVRKLTPTLTEARNAFRSRWTGDHWRLNVSLKGPKSLGRDGFEIRNRGEEIDLVAHHELGVLWSVPSATSGCVRSGHPRLSA